jgi:nucleoside-diphosphate-sugar epimerase
MYFLWEKYSKWSNGQLPPVYTRREWSVYRKKTYFSNAKIKDRLGWSPRVPMKDALRSFFESSRQG